MNHEEMLGLLHDYARGRLNEEERLSIQRALENDQSLREELGRVRAYYSDLKTLPEVKAPDDFLQKVRSRIERKSFFEKLRDLIFFPLYVKLPIEIAGTVAVALLVIIIFNPFATRVTVQEKYAGTEHKVYSDETPRKVLNNNEINNDEKNQAEKKTIAPVPSRKGDQAIAYAEKAGSRGSIRRSASFAEPMPSGQSRRRSFAPDGEFEGGLAEKSKTAESEVIAQDKANPLGKEEAVAPDQPQAMKESALKAVQPAGGYGSETVVSSRPEEMTRGLEMTSSAPASQSASGRASINEQQSEPLAFKKVQESPQEQFAYTWTPETPTGYVRQSADYESSSKMEEIEAKPVLSKSKADLAAKKKSQVTDQITTSNTLKSDNLEYLKISVNHAGGSLKVVNQGALQYRIKIPAKNFKLLEKDLNKKGAFSSAEGIDLNKFSSNNTVEIFITIQD